MAPEFVQAPGHLVYRHGPKLPTTLVKRPGSHQGNMSSSKMCNFFITSSVKKSLILYSLSFPLGKKPRTVSVTPSQPYRQNNVLGEGRKA